MNKDGEKEGKKKEARHKNKNAYYGRIYEEAEKRYCL